MSYPPQAVIFDMDGLLLDTERVALAAYREAAGRLGIDADEELFASFVGKDWDTTNTLMEQALGRTGALAMRDAWTIAFERKISAEGVPKKPGADALLEMLARRGTRTALATATGRDKTRMQLEKASLDGCFCVVTTGDEVERGKPSPDIFLLTSERLGIGPGQCIVLEDSEAGVEAAYLAGMRVLMVPDLKRPSDRVRSMAHHVCVSLAHAQALLETVLGS